MSLYLVFMYPVTIGYIPWKVNTEQELLHHIYNYPVQFPSNIPISEDSKHFISATISVDPNKRLSLNSILQHPLIRKNKSYSYKTVSANKIDNNQYQK